MRRPLFKFEKPGGMDAAAAGADETCAANDRRPKPDETWLQRRMAAPFAVTAPGLIYHVVFTLKKKIIMSMQSARVHVANLIQNGRWFEKIDKSWLFGDLNIELGACLTLYNLFKRIENLIEIVLNTYLSGLGLNIGHFEVGVWVGLVWSKER